MIDDGISSVERIMANRIGKPIARYADGESIVLLSVDDESRYICTRLASLLTVADDKLRRTGRMRTVSNYPLYFNGKIENPELKGLQPYTVKDAWTFLIHGEDRQNPKKLDAIVERFKPLKDERTYKGFKYIGASRPFDTQHPIQITDLRGLETYSSSLRRTLSQ